jgi:hypothetical protein
VGDENGKSLLPIISLIRKELLHLGFPKSSAHPQADSARLAKVGGENSKFLLLLMTRNGNQCLFRIAPKALHTLKLISPTFCKAGGRGAVRKQYQSHPSKHLIPDNNSFNNETGAVRKQYQSHPSKHLVPDNNSFNNETGAAGMNESC